MIGKSKKNREVERFVDRYISKNGTPPTYTMISNKFNLSRCAAYSRCAKFRDKMRQNKQQVYFWHCRFRFHNSEEIHYLTERTTRKQSSSFIRWWKKNKPELILVVAIRHHQQ